MPLIARQRHWRGGLRATLSPRPEIHRSPSGLRWVDSGDLILASPAMASKRARVPVVCAPSQSSRNILTLTLPSTNMAPDRGSLAKEIQLQLKQSSMSACHSQGLAIERGAKTSQIRPKLPWELGPAATLSGRHAVSPCSR